MKTILRFYETDVRDKSQYFMKGVDDNEVPPFIQTTI